MFNAKHLLQRMLLALSLSATMALAQAAPVSYHVNVNTGALTGAGYFDIVLGTSPSQTPLTATFSNFTGAFTGVDNTVSYNYATTATGFSLSNSIANYLSRTVNFGASLGFDVVFDGAFLTATTLETEQLSFTLFDIDGGQLSSGDAINIAGFGANRISVPAGSGFVAVTVNGPVGVVPEPAALLLLLTGLGLMGVMVRRRQG